MKVMTVVGTRPEVIRLSATLQRLDATRGIDHVLVHTGQNWDRQLNEVFFDELRLRRPDHYLNVDTSSLGSSLGEIISKTDEVIEVESPDAFLVLGDTNSALALIIAKRRKIPTYHMEAGNRCFDANVPEEVNRRLVDHTADFNLVYTLHARQNLLAEGLEPRRIVLTGSPMREVLTTQLDSIRQSAVLADLGLEAGRYFLVSAHREENVDNQLRLEALMSSLSAVADRWRLPVLVSAHPRTRRRLNDFGITSQNPLVSFHPPFGFLDYNKLQLHATCVLSDSGTVSEESAILGFPAVTLRSSIERPEALDTAAITLVDVDPGSVIAGVEFALSNSGDYRVPADYSIENTSQRVVNFIVSTAHQHKQWSGLR